MRIFHVRLLILYEALYMNHQTSNGSVHFDKIHITEIQEKDLKIEQLETDLKNTKNELKKLMDSAPKIEELYIKLNNANEENSNLNCTISTLQTRIKQLQNNNSQLKSQIQKYKEENTEKIKQENKIETNMEIKLQEQTEQLKLDNTTLYRELNQITGDEFFSHSDIVNYFKSYQSRKIDTNEYEKLKIKNRKLKNKINRIKNKQCLIQDESIDDISEIILENTNLKDALEESLKAIEMMKKENYKIDKKANCYKAQIIKLKNQIHEYQDTLENVKNSTNNINDPRISQLQKYLEEKTNDNEKLNQRLISLSAEKAEFEKQYSLAIQQQKDQCYYKDLIQDEINNLKMNLRNSEEERECMMEMISRLENEKIMLDSEIQEANQKCILMSSKIQEYEINKKNSQNKFNEFDKVVRLLENIIDSQKKDLCDQHNSRKLLGELLLKQNNVLASSEIILSQYIERNSLLKTKLNSFYNNNGNVYLNDFSKIEVQSIPNQNGTSNIDYYVLGFVKNLLISELSIDLQQKYNSILHDSSITMINRLKNVFHNICELLNAQHLSSQNQTIKNDYSSSDVIDVIGKLKTILKESNYINESKTFDSIIPLMSKSNNLFQIFSYFISAHDQYEARINDLTNQIQQLKEAYKITGCSNGTQLKKFLEKLIHTYESNESKLKSYRDIAASLKDELQNKMNEIENLKEENHNEFKVNEKIMKQELKKFKNNEIKLKTRAENYKKEIDSLQLKLNDIIAQNEFIRLQSTKKLEEQRKQYEESINKIALSTSSNDSSRIADFQNIYDLLEKRYQNEISLLNKQIEEVTKSKSNLANEYKKREEESEKSINHLIDKCNKSQLEIEKLEKEISQIRLEKKTLEIQIKSGTQNQSHLQPFATLID